MISIISVRRGGRLAVSPSLVYILGCAAAWHSTQEKVQGGGGAIGGLSHNVWQKPRHRGIRVPVVFVDGHAFIETAPTWWSGSSVAWAKRAAKTEWHNFDFNKWAYEKNSSRW